MRRRDFLAHGLLALALPAPARNPGSALAVAARAQLGVTSTYNPSYTRIPYPLGDVPRSTGVCADVIIRAGRDALALDLQRLVHEDMQHNFAAYPRTWGLSRPDPNIDHRRVLNLEVFWQRAGTAIWRAKAPTSGDAFPSPLAVGDILTWLLDARLPHVGIVVSTNSSSPLIIHNIGAGVQQISLTQMSTQRAQGHFRWPST